VGRVARVAEGRDAAARDARAGRDAAATRGGGGAGQDGPRAADVGIGRSLAARAERI
jgi:hypothetical protein